MNNLKSILKGSLLIMIVGIIFPKFVLAVDRNTLSGTTLSSPGGELSYDVVVNSDKTIDEYSATLTYETSILEFVGIENKGNWKSKNNITETSPCELSFEHESGVTGETKIATLKFKIKSDVTKTDTLITIEGKIASSEDDTIVKLDKSSITVSIRSKDNTLSDLQLNGKTIVNFSPKTYSYSMQVDAAVTTASIDATLNNKTASFVDKYGSRSVPLDYGENTIEIKVKSASGEEKTYVLNIFRQDNRGTNNDLKSLILNSGKIKLDFDKNTLKYTIKTHKLTTIDVVATPEDSKAKVQVDAPKEIVIGSNTIKIVVTSEDGNDKTYEVVLNNVDYDIDTSLKNIEIFGCEECNENLKFDPEVFDYELIYKNDYKDSIVIKAIVNSDEDDVKIDEPLLEKTLSELSAGSTVKIRVYADEVESLYTITFVKDTRLNFFLIVGVIIFIILLIVFIRLFLNFRNINKMNKNITSEIEKTKELKKINLE